MCKLNVSDPMSAEMSFRQLSIEYIKNITTSVIYIYVFSRWHKQVSYTPNRSNRGRKIKFQAKKQKQNGVNKANCIFITCNRCGINFAQRRL